MIYFRYIVGETAAAGGAPPVNDISKTVPSCQGNPIVSERSLPNIGIGQVKAVDIICHIEHTKSGRPIDQIMLCGNTLL